MPTERDKGMEGMLVGCGGAFVLVLVLALIGWFAWRRLSGAGLALSTSSSFPPITAPMIPQVSESAGLRVELGPPLGTDVVFTRGAENYVYKPPSGTFCEDPVVALDGATAYLRCSQQSGGGYDHDAILKFSFGSDPLRPVTPDRLLEGSALNTLLHSSQAWVMNLDGISSSGQRLLLRLAWMQAAAGSSQVRYRQDRPYWYDLATKTLIEPDM